MDQRYTRTVRELSEALIEVQRPIRVLDAVQWDDDVRDAFLAAKGREQPPVDRHYYESRRPLRFDPVAKRDELSRLEGDVVSRLGRSDPVAVMLLRMTDEYRQIVEMLVARGTPEFCDRARELYGASSERVGDGDLDLGELAWELARTLDRIDGRSTAGPEPTYGGAEAVALLQERLDRVFDPAVGRVQVCASDGITADAAAGADRIKLRQDARFTERELRLLEVHEGWVHVGTTLNGSLQKTCTFLSKGTPSSTITQEGLAVFMEVVTLVSYPDRIRKIANRVRALSLAEASANFRDVVCFFQEEGFGLEEAYAQATRIFRGSTPTGGGFSKDLSYLKGFIQVQAALALAVREGRVERLPLLFCGKVSVGDLDAIHTLVESGVVERPRHLPPQFADPHALTAWLCFANYISSVPFQNGAVRS